MIDNDEVRSETKTNDEDVMTEQSAAESSRRVQHTEEEIGLPANSR